MQAVALISGRLHQRGLAVHQGVNVPVLVPSGANVRVKNDATYWPTAGPVLCRVDSPRWGGMQRELFDTGGGRGEARAFGLGTSTDSRGHWTLRRRVGEAVRCRGVAGRDPGLWVLALWQRLRH